MSKRYKGYVCFNGKKHWVDGKSRLDVERKKARLLVELENNLISYDGDMLYEIWSKKWIEIYKANISTSYRKSIEGYLKNVINPVIGSLAIGKIKPIHIQNIFKRISNKSSSYNKKVYLILSESLQTAVDNEIITKSPIGKFKQPKGAGAGKRRALTDEEEQTILRVAKTHRGGLFILIMYYCGLRPQEVAVLIWKDIDFDSGYIDVNKALKSDGTIGSTKSVAGIRQVPIPSPLLARLNKEKGSPFDLVCTNTKGNAYTKSSILAMWRNFVRAMNIELGCRVYRNKLMPPYRVAEDLTLYCLRHNYCTKLEEAGVPLNIAKTLMGHSDVSTTAKIYTHTDRKALDIAKNLIEDAV